MPINWAEIADQNAKVADVLETKLAQANRTIEQRGEQIEKLANFIIEKVPGEPSQSEGAVDTAIRIIEQQAQELAAAKKLADSYLRGHLSQYPPQGDPTYTEEHWIRMKVDAAIRQLRDLEDAFRPSGEPGSFNEQRANRARDIYEQLTSDFLNGKINRPTIAQRLAATELALGAATALLHELHYGYDNSPDSDDSYNELLARIGAFITADPATHAQEAYERHVAMQKALEIIASGKGDGIELGIWGLQTVAKDALAQKALGGK